MSIGNVLSKFLLIDCSANRIDSDLVGYYHSFCGAQLTMMLQKNMRTNMSFPGITRPYMELLPEKAVRNFHEVSYRTIVMLHADNIEEPNSSLKVVTDTSKYQAIAAVCEYPVSVIRQLPNNDRIVNHQAVWIVWKHVSLGGTRRSSQTHFKVEDNMLVVLLDGTRMVCTFDLRICTAIKKDVY